MHGLHEGLTWIPENERIQEPDITRLGELSQDDLDVLFPGSDTSVLKHRNSGGSMNIYTSIPVGDGSTFSVIYMLHHVKQDTFCIQIHQTSLGEGSDFDHFSRMDIPREKLFQELMNLHTLLSHYTRSFDHVAIILLLKAAVSDMLDRPVSDLVEFRGVYRDNVDQLYDRDRNYFWFLQDDEKRDTPGHIVPQAPLEFGMHIFPYAEKISLSPGIQLGEDSTLNIFVTSIVLGERYESEYNLVAKERMDVRGNWEYAYQIVGDDGEVLQDFGTLEELENALNTLYSHEIAQLSNTQDIRSMYTNHFQNHNWEEVFSEGFEKIQFCEHNFSVIGSVSSTEGPQKIQIFVACVQDNGYEISVLARDSGHNRPRRTFVDRLIPGDEVLNTVEQIGLRITRASDRSNEGQEIDGLISEAIRNIDTSHRTRRKLY